MYILSFLVLIILYLKQTFCTDDIAGAQEYLIKFGYLSPLENNAIVDSEELTRAIKKFQKFANIPITGKFDLETIRLMRTKRCGVPDYKSLRDRRFALYSHRKFRNTNNITWTLASENIGSLNRTQVRSEIQRAFDIWSNKSTLKFQESKNSGDIKIYFYRGSHGDNSPFDGKGYILAHAFFPGNSHEGDVHFDLDEEWLLYSNQTDEEGVRLYQIAAHEFGHSLGIDHSSQKDSLMYPFYKASNLTTLSDDDTFAIQSLYGTVSQYNKRFTPTLPNVTTTPTPTLPIITPTPTLPIITTTPTLPIITTTPTLPIIATTPTLPIIATTPTVGPFHRINKNQNTCSNILVVQEIKFLDTLIMDVVNYRIQRALIYKNTTDYNNSVCSHRKLINSLIILFQKYFIL